MRGLLDKLEALGPCDLGAIQLPPPRKPLPKKKKTETHIGINEMRTNNPLVPTVKLGDDVLEMLPLPRKDEIDEPVLNTKTSFSAKKRYREKVLAKFRNNQSQPLDIFAKTAMECGLGSNPKEAERVMGELATRGYHFSHATGKVVRDDERKITFISAEEKFKETLQKKLQQ